MDALWWMDMDGILSIDCPNKDRLSDSGFIWTGYHLSQLSKLDIYIVLLNWDTLNSVRTILILYLCEISVLSQLRLVDIYIVLLSWDRLSGCCMIVDWSIWRILLDGHCWVEIVQWILLSGYIYIASGMAWMDLMNRPNKDRLGTYGFIYFSFLTYLSYY